MKVRRNHVRSEIFLPKRRELKAGVKPDLVGRLPFILHLNIPVETEQMKHAYNLI